MPQTNPPIEDVARWHADASRRCLTCVEHGAPFDGGCDHCGYADPRWCSRHPSDPSGLWEEPS